MAKKVATKKASKKTPAKKVPVKKAPGARKVAKKVGAKGAVGAGAWTLTKAMAALKAKGSEQTKKTWGRHGATGDMFGVKFGDLYAIRKQIGTDHALAKGLWDTGNFDARLLAAMVADASAFTPAELDRWAASVETYFLANAVGDTVAKCPIAIALGAVDRWVGSPREYLSRCGWSALCSMVRDGVPIPNTKLRTYLRMIEERQASAPNRAREGMNLAMICIGSYGDASMAEAALAAAKRIGPIRIDHGDTACKDAPAIEYILKARAHRETMAAKKKAK